MTVRGLVGTDRTQGCPLRNADNTSGKTRSVNDGWNALRTKRAARQKLCIVIRITQGRFEPYLTKRPYGLGLCDVGRLTDIKSEDIQVRPHFIEQPNFQLQ